MAEKLDWLRRFVFTTIGFLFWGVAGTLLQLVLYPYARKHKHGDLQTQLKVRRFVGGSWYYFIRYLSCAGVLEVSYKGFEKLGRTGQLILPNHPSLLDVVLILGKTPTLNCIVKKELLDNPTMRNQILACGFLPNTESVELLEQSHEVLQQQALLLFAEGTRTGWNGEVKLNRGAVSIGLRSAKVITPVVIWMNPLSLKKGHPWYKIPRKRIHYELIVGDDIDPQDWLKEQSIPMASRRLTKYLENYFNTHIKDNENGTGTTA
ncbi:1-acyl-sn-glycerol-3-phosphate acyltransferase [Aggregatibacter actinomycetemcomitans]|uniref:lysophospholipid acyltransferase family protein n=1 Tax=Aggregatibacter actinomycetemcomitans TaxID=714 RepID=UPI0011DAFD75|nr:lysophospholipid acyltransferase family protein [Aggregatibacter actinomycetemcomitans]TYA88430.1 1-acyl-sn-glycerol-3-phosphate acyltransferase [Aggregatibacter actinomycetemcomitans]